MSVYPHTYTCRRQIRGEIRDVEVTRFSRTSESIKLLNHKSHKKNYRQISRAEARNFHNSRSTRSKHMDSKITNQNIVKDERFLHDPAHNDFPNVDTKGRGSFGGKGRKTGREQRHK